MKYFTKRVRHHSIEGIVKKLTSDLHNQGFVVLSDIDMRMEMSSKYSIDIMPYHIVAIFNQSYFHELYKCDDNVGLVFPSNIIIKQVDDTLEVVSIDPETFRLSQQNDKIDKMASAVHGKLLMVLDRL